MMPLPSIRPSYPKPAQATSGRVWLPYQPRRNRSGLRQPPQLVNRIAGRGQGSLFSGRTCGNRLGVHDVGHGIAMAEAGGPAACGPSGPAGPGRRAYRGFMDAVSGPAEWFAWWSWPWRAAGAGTSPFPSFAPQALSQPILPGWLFANSINVTEENSSSPETEREIVAAHSYGQQIGRIMDVLDELIRKQPAGSLGARSVREFAELRNDIETIKARQAAKRAEQMTTDLAAIKRRDPDEYRRLAAELRKVLEEDSGA
jgi:hypothetical protein